MHQACHRHAAADLPEDTTEHLDKEEQEEQEENGQEVVPAAARPEQFAIQIRQSPAKQQADRLISNQVQRNKGLQTQWQSLRAGVEARHSYANLLFMS